MRPRSWQKRLQLHRSNHYRQLRVFDHDFELKDSTGFDDDTSLSGYLSIRFGVSHCHIVKLFSLKEVNILLDDYQKLNGQICSKIAYSKLCKAVNYGCNLKLLHQDEYFWFSIFRWVLNNELLDMSEKKRIHLICYQLPFSWLICDYFRQISNISHHSDCDKWNLKDSIFNIFTKEHFVSFGRDITLLPGKRTSITSSKVNYLIWKRLSTFNNLDLSWAIEVVSILLRRPCNYHFIEMVNCCVVIIQNSRNCVHKALTEAPCTKLLQDCKSITFLKIVSFRYSQLRFNKRFKEIEKVDLLDECPEALKNLIGELFISSVTDSYSKETLVNRVDAIIQKLQKSSNSSLENFVASFLSSSYEISTPDLIETFCSDKTHNILSDPFSEPLCELDVLSFDKIIIEIIRKRVIEDNYQNSLSTHEIKDLQNNLQLGSHGLWFLFLKSYARHFGSSFLKDIKTEDNLTIETDCYRLLGEDYVTVRGALLEPNSNLQPRTIDPYHLMHAVLHLQQIQKIHIDDVVGLVTRPLQATQLNILNNLGLGKLFSLPIEDWEHNTYPLFHICCSILTLNPTNCITRFLHYINKYPLRIKGMFLPSMREDVVTKFQETLGEKFAAKPHHKYTWYQCENAHIYAINNCGEPQQKGKCFCGGAIGGVKHDLVKGNRRVEGYTFDEKGYNLPPLKFLSTIDTERNLRGLSLSFLRWLIHASLITSDRIHEFPELLGLQESENVMESLQTRLAGDLKGIQESLEVHNDDVVIWMLSSLLHLYSQEDDTDLELDTSANRARLEDLYLDMMTPMIHSPCDVITRGKELVYVSSDKTVQIAVGLAVPAGSTGLFQFRDYLEVKQPITEILKEKFHKMGNTVGRRYSAIEKYLKFKDHLQAVYALPRLVRMVSKVLKPLNNQQTQSAVRKMKINHFLTQNDVEFWNELWTAVLTLPQLISHIYISNTDKGVTLTLSSPLARILPAPSGPGLQTWFMLSTLTRLYNELGSPGFALDILEVGGHAARLPVTSPELFRLTADSYDRGVFDFGRLDKALEEVLEIKCRDVIDESSVNQLRFKPLKDKDSWHQILNQVDKNKSYGVSCDLIITPSLLHGLEKTLQLSALADYSMLSITTVTSAYNLTLPSDISRCDLFYFWHYCWLSLSLERGEFFVTEDEEGVTSPHPVTSLAGVVTSPELLITLHMMVVEWVVHYPGFDCSGMLLTEALEFYCERSKIRVCCFESLSESLMIEDGIQLISMMINNLDGKCIDFYEMLNTF